MKCFSCGRKAVICLDYIDRCYCRGCFLELLEQRLKKELRRTGFDSEKEYYMLETPTSWLAEFLLKKIFKDRLRIKKTKRMKNRDMIIPIYLEKYVSDFLGAMLEQEDPAMIIGKYHGENIYILKHFLWGEISLAGKLLGINPGKRESYGEVDILLEVFQGAHWNALFGAANSIEKLAGMIKTSPRKKKKTG